MGKTMNCQTQRLVAAAKGGEQAAVEQLCKTYSERIHRIIRMRMGTELRGKMESMDLVQDAMISAFRSLQDFTYSDEGDFLRWVSKIAENRVRDNLEKLHADKRDVRKEIPLIQDSNESFTAAFSPIDSTTPSLIVSRGEDLDKLEQAMSKLKEEYKHVIVLTKIEGLSMKEAGEKLGKSPDAVRMLLCRAMAALSGAFEEL